MSTHPTYRTGTLPVVLVHPHGPTFKDVMQKLAQDTRLQLFECKSQMDVVTLLADLPCAVILLYASKPDEVVIHTQMLKLIQPQIKKSRVRVVFNTSVQQIKVLNLMNYYGTSETITEPIAARAMLFKLQRHIKAVMQENAEKLGGEFKPQKESNAQGSRNSGREGRKEEKQGPKIRYTDAIGIASDCWLASKTQVKQIGKRWVIKLSGPGPSAGIWAKVQGDDTVWQWKPSAASGPGGQDLFVKDEGAWVFRGQKPDFQDDLWWFISNSPELSFLNGSDVKAKKMGFERETGTLLLAKDSIHAVKLMPVIRNSISNKSRLASNQGQNAGAGNHRQGPESLIEWMPALQIKSDCWLIEEKMPRKINGRWAIRVTGPGPSAGRWQEVKSAVKDPDGSHSAERETQWHWTPARTKDDPFVQDKGTWVYHGRQPKFEGDHWLFIADRPSLGFFAENQLLGSKFDFDPSKKLNVAKDSTQAIAKMPEIRRSHALVSKRLDQKGEGKEGEYGGSVGEEAQELAYGSGGSRARREKNEEFRIPREAFGDAQGIWEKANAGQKGRVWAVFIPTAWMSGDLTLPMIRQHKSFFVYKGSRMPLLDAPKIQMEGSAGDWIFLGSEPTQYGKFDELPPIVRNFLKSLVEGKGKEKDSTDTIEARAERAREEAAIEAEAVAEESGSKATEDSESTAASAQAVNDSTSASTSVETGSDSPTPAAETSAEPALTALALMFAAAELSGNTSLGAEGAARKMAHYVSRFAQHTRAEFWIEAPSGDWIVTATSDGSNGLLHRWAARTVTQPVQIEGAWVIPITEKGRVILDSPRQKRAPISEADIQVIALAMQGIITSLVQSQALPKKTA